MSDPTPAPLDAEQLRVLQDTRKLDKKLAVARGIALTNAVSMALLAVLSLLSDLFSLSFSPVALALGLLAYNEERGRRRLIAFDPRAGLHLAYNQLAIFLLVLLYCSYQAYSAWAGPDPLAELTRQAPELGDTLSQLGSAEDLGGFARIASLVVYAVVLAVSGVVQGLLALYYRSLRVTLEALARAPEWARALV